MHRNPDYWQENIPAEMQASPQWMVCQGPKNKAPLTLSGYPGNPTDPHNWSTFADAYCKAVENHWLIGYCLSANGYTITDLDNKNGDKQIAEYIEKTVDRFNTYVERSISGKGYHAVFRGDIGPGRRRAPIEIYSRDRFMIMTGDVVKNLPISADQELLSGLASWCGPESEHEQVLIDWTSEPTPEELDYDNRCLQWIEANFPNVAKIMYLFEAQDFSDPNNHHHSENDAALMQLFYKFNQWRPEQRERATIRMFLRTPRAQYLTRKTDWHQYIARTLGFVKSQVDQEEIEVDRPMLMNAANNFVAGSNVLPFPQQQVRPPLPSPDIKSVVEIAEEPDVEWMLENVFQAQSVNTIYGQTGAGKSFIGLDLLLHVAQGKDWFGHETKQSNGLYIALEGRRGLPRRLKAWKAAKGPLPDNVEVYGGKLNLMSPMSVAQFIQLRKQAGKLGELIIIDTFIRAVPGAEENSNSEMQLALTALEVIRDELGACIVVLHHSTKGGVGIRGASAIIDAVDGTIEVRKNFNEQNKYTGRSIHMEKIREGETGLEGDMFDLDKKQIGTHTRKNGELVFDESCVVLPNGQIVEANAGRPDSHMGRGKRKSKTQTDREEKEEIERQAERACKMKPQEAVRRAITELATECKTIGKFGGPDKCCALRDEVMKRAIALYSHPIAGTGKQGIGRAIDAMLGGDHPKLGHHYENDKYMWIWEV